MLLFVSFLSGCIDLEQVGAYTCDEYCEQILDKTEECAADQDLGEYASQAREDWKDASRNEMIASCESDLKDAGTTDTVCQAETAAINNLTCDQILDTIGSLADGL